jgi:hypothetical protein
VNREHFYALMSGPATTDSPHVYNTAEEIDLVLAVLAASLSAK